MLLFFFYNLDLNQLIGLNFCLDVITHCAYNVPKKKYTHHNFPTVFVCIGLIKAFFIKKYVQWTLLIFPHVGKFTDLKNTVRILRIEINSQLYHSTSMQ